MPPKRYVYNYNESQSKLQDFSKLLRCLEESSDVPEDFVVVDKETRIEVLKSASLYPDSYIIKCLMSLIKEEVLEGRPIRCVLQPPGSFTCTVEKVQYMTISVLKHYRIPNLKSLNVVIEAAICKIMEGHDSTGTSSGASTSSKADK